MVVFDLICANGHRFEGWFSSLAELEEQVTMKILTCPICGDGDIVRRPSTFGLVRHRPAEPPVQPEAPEGGPGRPPERVLEALRQLAEMSRTLERDFSDVGADFTAEALKMHYGVTPRRNIRGMSTSDEERVLQKEGIEFFKIPMLVSKKPATS